jgi:hypothetical protein
MSLASVVLPTTLPRYTRAQDARAAADVATHRMRTTRYEETEVVALVAQQIARGEPLPGGLVPAPDASYETLAAQLLQRGLLRDLELSRAVGVAKQCVSVAQLASPELE